MYLNSHYSRSFLVKLFLRIAGVSYGRFPGQFPGNDLVVLLDIALHYFTSRINWVNKTRSKKEIIKTICNSVNHTRFPKDDHLPDWARRDNKVTKGDRVEHKSRFFALLASTLLIYLPDIRRYVIRSALSVITSTINKRDRINSEMLNCHWRLWFHPSPQWGGFILLAECNSF